MEIGPRLSFCEMDMGGGAIVFRVIERACVEMGFTRKSGGAIGHRRAAFRAEEAFDIRGRAVEGGPAPGPSPCAIGEAEE